MHLPFRCFQKFINDRLCKKVKAATTTLTVKKECLQKAQGNSVARSTVCFDMSYELSFSYSIFIYKCLPVYNNNRLRTTCNKQKEQIKLQKCNISYDPSCMQMHQKWKIGTSVIISLDSLRQLGNFFFFLEFGIHVSNNDFCACW